MPKKIIPTKLREELEKEIDAILNSHRINSKFQTYISTNNWFFNNLKHVQEYWPRNGKMTPKLHRVLCKALELDGAGLKDVIDISWYGSIKIRKKHLYDIMLLEDKNNAIGRLHRKLPIPKEFLKNLIECSNNEHLYTITVDNPSLTYFTPFRKFTCTIKEGRPSSKQSSSSSSKQSSSKQSSSKQSSSKQSSSKQSSSTSLGGKKTAKRRHKHRRKRSTRRRR